METVQDNQRRDEIAAAPTAARAAALWSAKQVGAPTFRNTNETDSPEDRRNGDFAGVMASMIAERSPVSSEQGTKFADEVERRIDAILGRTNWVSLGVDYGPDLELFEAAKAAGVNASRFPWKTHMSITKDYVTAALGYGAPSTLIWQAPDWVRPACGSQRYERVAGEYKPRDEVCGLPRFHDGDHGNYQPDTRKCEGCDLTYTSHYAKAVKDGYTHSWEPTS